MSRPYHGYLDEWMGRAVWAKSACYRSESAINAHANRMVSLPAPDEASLVTLFPEDIPNA